MEKVASPALSTCVGEEPVCTHGASGDEAVNSETHVNTVISTGIKQLIFFFTLDFNINYTHSEFESECEAEKHTGIIHFDEIGYHILYSYQPKILCGVDAVIRSQK